jgi:hypothetical protein
MLLKEKVFLSNCDSVRALPPEELHKRFLLGLTVASGVVVSPNTLLDNREVSALLRRRNVLKYLNEEGAGQFVLRGFNFTEGVTLDDYFDGLPDDYIVSSVDGSPQKNQLTRVQAQSLIARLRETQQALQALQPVYKPILIQPNSLQLAIAERLQDPDILGHFFHADGDREVFMLSTEGLNSRSKWYQFSNNYFRTSMRFGVDASDRFRLEVIDPAYHSLFVDSGEGFLQDQIKHLSGLPEGFLNAGLTFKSLRNELSALEIPYKLFQLVSTWGASDLIKLITDEALSYVEDKATDKGFDFATRKNWFGLYPKMRRYIGLEIKK